MALPSAKSHELARIDDAKDALFQRTRKEFLIPSKAELRNQQLSRQPVLPALEGSTDSSGGSDPCVYLCGNSLGLQPRLTSIRINQYLKTWSTQGVFGHFKPLSNSPLPTWLNADEKAAKAIANIVGAAPSEVAVMETLTANLHLLMSSLYQPDPQGRHKIILESKAFPSDHFAVESQIRHWGLNPADSLVTIEPPPSSVLTTEHIKSIIAEHASETAILLLPGIQFYTGQFLDIPTITAFAHSHDILVIWDLAHAVGNVELALHDWDVDAAVWCSYKYLNAGPGSIGGLFVHDRISRISESADNKHQQQWRNRLAGWWGNSKATRFEMENRFIPTPGAAGFQLSNPSILDITSLSASLEIFALAGGMPALRQKSKLLTAYLEAELRASAAFHAGAFEIITSSVSEERGAQLSLRVPEEDLGTVMKGLEGRGCVVDERKPDVIRVAPAPLYNGYEDCWLFVQALGEVLLEVKAGKVGGRD